MTIIRTIHTAGFGGLESLGGLHAGGSFKSGSLDASLGERFSSGPWSMMWTCQPFVRVVVTRSCLSMNTFSSSGGAAQDAAMRGSRAQPYPT